MLHDALLLLINRGVDLALAGIVAWAGSKLKKLIKDLGAYFDMVRASMAISFNQENRLRKLEGQSALTDEQWRDQIALYVKGKARG